MTKQEEIREGMYQIALPRVCRLRPEIDIKGAQQAQLLIDELRQYLHSQGVVVKVEGELPFVDWSFDKRVGFLSAIDAGYVAVEPIIKEGK